MSDFNSVMLIAENKIKLDAVHLYHFKLPAEFVETPGERQISVCLVYDPPIRRNRIDYMGINFEFHLFDNSEVMEIIAGYKSIKIDPDLEEIVPEQLNVKQIKLSPGTRTRKLGLHQKGIKIFHAKPRMDVSKPLILAIVSQNRWVIDPDYLQNYAVIVTIIHQAKIDLYNQIKEQIELEQRVRIRTC
jgi:hypothetical protein